MFGWLMCGGDIWGSSMHCRDMTYKKKKKKKCSHRELNPRPSADLDKCKADALPTEL